jgi:hypothetical protein
MATLPQDKFLIAAALGLVIIIGGYYVLTTPDTRNTGEKVSDAINEMPNGMDKAVRQLEDRTPAEKLGDAAEDAGEDLKKSINQ